MDDALVSRVDIAAELKMDREARRQIWMNGLNAFGRSGKFDDDRDSDDIK